jgi:hypothetical protein
MESERGPALAGAAQARLVDATQGDQQAAAASTAPPSEPANVARVYDALLGGCFQ